MWRHGLFFVAFVSTAFIPRCLADPFTDAAAQLPQCGLTCILDALPKSACSSVLNETCICTDQDLTNVVRGCVLQTCTVLEQLEVARLQAQACELPVRSRKGEMLIPLVVEIPALICLILRLYSRWLTMNRFELDDWVMMFVGVIDIVFVGIGQTAGNLAFGVDTWTVSPENLTQALKLFYIDESFYLVILTLTKVSIMFFYLRIFPNRAFRIATYLVMGWVLTSNIIFVFLQIFQCTPVSYNWEGWLGTFDESHRCLDVNTLSFTAAGFSIAQDAVLILLPLPLLVSLNASWRARAGIIIMFSLGVFVLITSCVRLRSLLLFARSLNPSWDYTSALVWTGSEVAVSIIVTSLPAIRVLVNRVAPNLFGTLTGGSSSRRRRYYASTGEGGGGGDSGGGRRDHGSALSKRGAGGGSLYSASQKGGGGGGGREGGGGRGRCRQSKILSILVGPDDGTTNRSGLDNESQLELGDRKQGAVHTEIGAGYGYGYSFDDDEYIANGRRKEDRADERVGRQYVPDQRGGGSDGNSSSSGSEGERRRGERSRSRGSMGSRIHVHTTTTSTSTPLESPLPGTAL